MQWLLLWMNVAEVWAKNLGPHLVFQVLTSRRENHSICTRRAFKYSSSAHFGSFFLLSSCRTLIDLVDFILFSVNALPESAEITINYRVAVDLLPSFVKDQINSHLHDLAKEHDLSLDAFDSTSIEYGKNGHITAIALMELEAAPVTLTTTKQWALLAGTIGHAFSTRFPQGIVVSPSMDTGNTDSHADWNLTKEIFRFTPSDPKVHEFIHTVNEHINITDHLQTIWFFHELIRKSDVADLE